MGMMKSRWMTITLCDGRKLKFKFPIQATDETVVQRLEEALKLPSVTISADETLYVFPTSAIQMITVTPAPTKLPPTVIRAATRG